MKLGITMLIHNKDDIEFVTEFPCFLGHPVLLLISIYLFHISIVCINKRNLAIYYLSIQYTDYTIYKTSYWKQICINTTNLLTVLQQFLLLLKFKNSNSFYFIRICEKMKLYNFSFICKYFKGRKFQEKK